MISDFTNVTCRLRKYIKGLRRGDWTKYKLKDGRRNYRYIHTVRGSQIDLMVMKSDLHSKIADVFFLDQEGCMVGRIHLGKETAARGFAFPDLDPEKVIDELIP